MGGEGGGRAVVGGWWDVEGHQVLGGLCEGLLALEVGYAVSEVGVDGAIWLDGGVEVDLGEEGGDVDGLGGGEESHAGAIRVPRPPKGL